MAGNTLLQTLFDAAQSSHKNSRIVPSLKAELKNNHRDASPYTI
jgi:hypothetical protein